MEYLLNDISFNDLHKNNVSDNIFDNITKHSHEEYQYLDLIENIIENGHWKEGRNGKTKSIFGSSMRFSLKDGKIPILTTKKTAWKTCLNELLWFIRGETDVHLLQKQGVHIWDTNSSREFLDNRGLTHYPEGKIGPSYGYQWRHFDANYNYLSIDNDNDNDNNDNNDNNNDNNNNDNDNDNNDKGIDQLQEIIDLLKNPKTRNSRRLVMTAWNPKQLNQMALPPCHIMCQFNVHDGNKLSCAMFQRSVDVPVGSPFNIASYAFLTHLLAKHCDLEAYEFIYFMGNCHIYEEHINSVKLQVMREPYNFPTIHILQKKENINDYEINDFEIHNYQCHEVIKMNMIA
jgi:thymidylate synthase